MKNLKKASNVGRTNTWGSEEIVNKKKRYYANYGTVDIEVTNHKLGENEGVGVPYLWVFCSQISGDWYGRTIDEMVDFINTIKAQTDNCVRYVIYVHNLSYEWQFMRLLFNWDEVFLTDKRSVLYAVTGNIEFRCSYMLSGKSLKKFLEYCNCKIQKLEYDYDILRYPWDEISEEDIEYCYHDSKGLLEALEITIGKGGDNIATVPLTATGYVRRDVKRVQSIRTKRRVKMLSTLDCATYLALKHSFVGGNTHCNRWYTGQMLEDVYCYDITSSYPFVQLTGKFPMDKFRPVNIKWQDIGGCEEPGVYLMEFYGIELRDVMDGMPQISFSKCLDFLDADVDNGRVLQANKIVLWMTDVEYDIVSKHYEWVTARCVKGYKSRYGEIPDEIKSVILRYFESKCLLKGIDDYEYRRSKENLNSIYGMSAFDVGKVRYEYLGGEYCKQGEELEEILRVQASHQQAEPYCWGVWTTAQARKNLDEAIRLAGDRFIYCDTDSVYTFGKMEGIEKINDRVKHEAAPYTIEENGKKFVPGLWELDKHCQKFISHGAKKYAYVDDKGEVKTVTAGVGKKAGVDKIEDYKIGHVFRCATTHAKYNDSPSTLYIKGRKVNIPSNTYLESANYTLGYSNDYQALLTHIRGEESVQVFHE